jgi:hypothetical protein
VVSQLVQLPGAVLILIGYVGAQAGWLNQKSRLYLLANALGSAALAVNAAWFQQWGFLLLEGSWSIVSLIGLLSAAPRDAASVSAASVDKPSIEEADCGAVVSRVS